MKWTIKKFGRTRRVLRGGAVMWAAHYVPATDETEEHWFIKVRGQEYLHFKPEGFRDLSACEYADKMAQAYTRQAPTMAGQ